MRKFKSKVFCCILLFIYLGTMFPDFIFLNPVKASEGDKVIETAQVTIPTANSDTPSYDYTFNSGAKITNAYMKNVPNGATTDVTWDNDGNINIKFSGGTPVETTKTDTLKVPYKTDLRKQADVISFNVPAGREVIGVTRITGIEDVAGTLHSIDGNQIKINVTSNSHIPHYYYLRGLNKNSSYVNHESGNRYIFTFPYTQTYYINNPYMKPTNATGYFKQRGNGYLGTDTTTRPRDEFVYDKNESWGGAGWHRIDEFSSSGVSNYTQITQPFWNRTRLTTTTDNFNFDITLMLDRWEYQFEIDYEYKAQQYTYGGVLVYEYETTAAPKPTGPPTADFSIPSSGYRNQPIQVSEKSKAAPGRILIEWDWSISTNEGSTWSTLEWGQGDFAHTFTANRTYFIRLVVKDDAGRVSEPCIRSITIGDPEPPNQPPVADFDIWYEFDNYVFQGVSVGGRDNSYDPDGEITRRRFRDVDKNKTRNFTVRYENDDIDYFLFREAGRFDIYLEVRDDKGATAISSTQQVNVLPTPYAKITRKGIQKENRRVIFSSHNSVGADADPIDHALSEWVITPVSGLSQSDILIDDETDIDGEIHVLFRKPGTVRVELKVTSVNGKSDTTSDNFTIVPDAVPVANFNIPNTILRNPNTRNAEIKAVDASRSYDGDLISERNWKLYFDDNNNGTASKLLKTVTGNAREFITDVFHVGRYRLELDVKEEFGQPTIERFVSDSDRRTAKEEKTIIVDNVPPKALFETIPSVKADVQIHTSNNFFNALNNAIPGFESNLRSSPLVNINITTGTESFNATETYYKEIAPEFNTGLVPATGSDAYLAAGTETYLVRMSDLRYYLWTFDGQLLFNMAFDSAFYDSENEIIFGYDHSNSRLRTYDAKTGDLIRTYNNFLLASANDRIQNITTVNGYYYIYTSSSGLAATINTSNHNVCKHGDIGSPFVDDDGAIYYVSSRTVKKRMPNSTTDIWESEILPIRQHEVIGSNKGYILVHGTANVNSGNYYLISVNSSNGTIRYATSHAVEGIGNYNNRADVYGYVNKDTVVTLIGRVNRRTNNYDNFFGLKILDANTGALIADEIIEDEDYRSSKSSVTWGNVEFYDSIDEDAVYIRGRIGNYDVLGIRVNLISRKMDYCKTIGDALISTTMFHRGTKGDFWLSTTSSTHIDYRLYDAKTGNVIQNHNNARGETRGTYRFYPILNSPDEILWYNSTTFSGNREYHRYNIINVESSNANKMIHSLEIQSNSFSQVPVYAIKIGDHYAITLQEAASIIGTYESGVLERITIPWSNYHVVSTNNKYNMRGLNTGSMLWNYYYQIYDPGFWGIIDKINKMEWREDGNRYLSIILNNDVNYTDNQIQHFLNKVNEVGAKIIFIGRIQNTSLGRTLAEATNGTFILYNGTIQDGLNKLQQYIINDSVDYVDSLKPNVFLVNDEVAYETYYSDYESDAHYDTRWTYTHLQSYEGRIFQNWLGKAAFSGKSSSDPVEVFDKPGFYLVNLQKRDNPAGNTRFLEYYKWSEPNEILLVVHRKPIAEFTVSANNPSDYLGGNKYKTGARLNINNLSYDPDFTDGIVETVVRYKKLDSDRWITANNPSNFYVYESGTFVIQMQVMDNYGAWSEPYNQVITTEGTPPANIPPYANINTKSIAYTNDPQQINISYGDVDGYVNNVRLRIMQGGSVIATPISKNVSTSHAEENTNYTFTKTGLYTLELRVRDNNGTYTTVTRNVEVIEPVLPSVSITSEGIFKENRKISLNLSAVKGTYDIDWNSVQWSFQAISGGSNDDIKIGNITSSTTRDLIVKKAGAYRATATLKDIKGNSVSVVFDLDIIPDIAPVADFEVNKTAYRDPNNYSMATFDIVSNAQSTDNDYIQTVKWHYRFDSNNNGVFDGEWIEFDENVFETKLELPMVGKYQIRQTAIEGFGQETIDYLIDENDYLQGEQIIVVEVLNKRPETSMRLYGQDRDIPDLGDNEETSINIADYLTEGLGILGYPVTYEITYADPENDKIKQNEFNYIFENIFDGVDDSMYHGKTFYDEVRALDKPGKYKVTYKALDEPTYGNNDFANYRSYSEPVMAEIILHRKPVADFEVWHGAFDQGELDTFVAGSRLDFLNTSYDPDFLISRSDRGIMYSKFELRKVGEEEFSVIPANYRFNEIGQYYVKLTVRDVHGAEDTTTKLINIVPELTAELIPDTTTANSTVTINARAGKDTDRVYAQTLGLHAELSLKDISGDYSYWQGELYIPSTQEDINTEVIVTANTLGMRQNVSLPLSVYTPVELNATIEAVKNSFNLYDNGIPVTEDIVIKDIVTECVVDIASIKLDFVEINYGQEKSIGAYTSADISSKEDIYTYWNDKVYKIPSDVYDTANGFAYKVKFTITLENGNVAIKYLPMMENIKVNTPINLKPYINNAGVGEEVFIVMDDKIHVRTSNTPYTSSVQVTFPFDVMNEGQSITYSAGTPLSLNGSLGDAEFSRSFYLPIESVTEGDTYTIQFRAFAANHTSTIPNMETKSIKAKAIGLKLEELKMIFTGDISWKDYYFDTNNNFKPGRHIITNNMPTDNIKAGYNVYYMLKSKGLNNPGDYVEVNISYNKAIPDLKQMHKYQRFIRINTLNQAREYHLQNEFNNLASNEQLWVLIFTTPINAPSGTRVYFDISAYKDSISYNYNEHSASEWGGSIGNVLLLQGNIREDIGSSVSH